MFARVHSAAVMGVDGYIVDVETDLEFKLPSFATVGLAEGAVKESKERVTSAIKNSGYSFPQKRVTINLAPADVRKEGSAFDLPIAVGILAADRMFSPQVLDKFMLVGELSLDGALRHVRGVLPIPSWLISQLMQKTQRSPQLVRKIVPEPPLPTSGFSSPKWG